MRCAPFHRQCQVPGPAPCPRRSQPPTASEEHAGRRPDAPSSDNASPTLRSSWPRHHQIAVLRMPLQILRHKRATRHHLEMLRARKFHSMPGEGAANPLALKLRRHLRMNQENLIAGSFIQKVPGLTVHLRLEAVFRLLVRDRYIRHVLTVASMDVILAS